MRKLKFFSFLFIVLIILFTLGAISVENKNTGPFISSIKSAIPLNIKNTLKKTLFSIPTLNKKVKRQELTIETLDARILELSKKVDHLLQEIQLTDIETKLIKSKSFNYKITSFKLPFLTRKEGDGKPTAYLGQNKDTVIVATGHGEFFSFKKNEIDSNILSLKKVKTNIKKLIKNSKFYSLGKIGIRDILLLDNKIYFSYIKEQQYGCYNTSIMVSNLDLSFFNFSEFFSYKDCVSQEIISKRYQSNLSIIHSGGRMHSFKDGKILFTTGYVGHYLAAQDKNSMFGKIISIDLNTKKYDFVALGSRNAQGLYYDFKNNVVVSTEHGPLGGDEINVNLNPDSDPVENYGWPISSYGKPQPTEPWLLKNPPLNSHDKHGFLEPIKYFVPSISISQIIKMPRTFNEEFINDFFIGTLGFKSQINEGDQSIHHIRFNDNFDKIIYEDVIKIGERIRDLIYIKEKKSVLMLLETVPAIAFLKITE